MTCDCGQVGPLHLPTCAVIVWMRSGTCERSRCGATASTADTRLAGTGTSSHGDASCAESAPSTRGYADDADESAPSVVGTYEAAR